MKTDTGHNPLLFLLIFVPSVCCYAQPHARKEDSLIVFHLIDKAEEFFSAGRYDSALYYCDQAEAVSKRRNYKKGTAYALIERTDILMDKSDLTHADLYPSTTNVIGQQLKDSLVMAISWMQMAQVKMYDNNPNAAIPFFEKCIRYFRTHPSKYAALAYNDFGYTWGLAGNLEKKADCLIRAVDVYETMGEENYGERAAAYNNLSTLYYDLNQKDKAIGYGKLSITYREKAGDIARLSLGCCNLSQMYLGINDAEAVKYLQLCVKYAEQSGDEARITHAYITSSLIASNRKDTKTALEFEYKAIAILEKSKRDPTMLSRRYISVGMGLAAQKGDSAKTVDYFHKAVALSLPLQDKYNLRDAFLQLSVFYKEHQNFPEAYSAYKKHIQYRDSIIDAHTRASIAETEGKYKTEKKDNEISRLNAAQRIKELQLEKQDVLITANLLEAQRRKKEIELLSQAKQVQELTISKQEEELEKQQLLTKNDAQRLKLADQEKQLHEKQLRNSRLVRNSLLIGVVLLGLIGYFAFSRYQLIREVQEQKSLLSMRNNIAKDLHDEIGSALTSIRILSEVSGKNLYKDQVKASSYLQKITDQSGQMQQSMSDIVWAIRPDNDKLENMVVRMREYISQTLEPKNIYTVFTIDEKALSACIGMQQRRDLLLIFKEAINNAAKYSAAGKVEVSLGICGNDLRLRIADNGKGFNTEKVTSSSGLANMRNRTEALHGVFNIQSCQEEGTSIDILFPAT